MKIIKNLNNSEILFKIDKIFEFFKKNYFTYTDIKRFSLKEALFLNLNGFFKKNINNNKFIKKFKTHINYIYIYSFQKQKYNKYKNKRPLNTEKQCLNSFHIHYLCDIYHNYLFFMPQSSIIHKPFRYKLWKKKAGIFKF